MENLETLPRSLAVENRAGVRITLLLTMALFLLLFLPWLTSQRELFRQEGLFATIAYECTENTRTLADGIPASAHHTVIGDAFPLYPLTVSLVYRLGVPMENALRIVSVTMLGILSFLAGAVAASRCNFRAGAVAACCCFGTLFALEKASVGGADAMAGCFLFAAQILFFHYGSRLADWNSAWVSAAILVTLGFLTAGPVVILFFAVPVLFLRRPLSSVAKYRTPGFAAGVVLLAVVIIGWGLPLELALRQYAVESGFAAVSLTTYLKDLAVFPLLFPIRMLPWAVIMWMPFCVALQAVSPLPVLGLYLRTLFFSMLALAWLLPGVSTSQMFFFIGPLAVLTGIYYDLGVRRYGVKLRKIVAIGAWMFPLAGAYLLMIRFLPEEYLGFFGDPEKMVFRTEAGYLETVCAALGAFTVLALLFNAGLRKFPLWVELVLLNIGIAVIGIAALLPYKMQEKEWRTFGNDVRRVLPPDAERIYKYDIQGMYSGLFYTGKPVYKLHKGDTIPEDGTDKPVYVISPRFPDLPDRRWESLLPENYTCRGVKLSLWRGTAVKPDYLESGNE